LIYFYRFVSKIILFQEALQFRATIVLCYNRQIAMRTTNCVPSHLIKHISQIIVDVLFLIVSACFLNKSHEHWLFFDALNATISMSSKL